MGHGQAVVTAAAVLQAEHGLVDRVPATAFPPDLGRMQAWQQELLCSGGLHFLTQDALEFVQAASSEWQDAVQPGGQLAHEAGAQQQLM